MRKLISALMLLLLSANTYSQGTYYVWVDENGITNYAQQSPKGLNAEQVTSARRFGDGKFPANDLLTLPSRGSRPGARAEPISTAVDPDEVIAEQKATMAAKIAQQKTTNCEIGKKNLTSLEMFKHIRVKAEDGTEKVLSDEERAQRTATARQVIRENCSG
ncbi:MAG: DUF4124 domain-containing protein [Pseudomonadales bacterium]|jgi:hypothetical protein|nr:DUF4124 domain-containing protein [Pseudomonadales bacterium]MDP4765456.1 DUF4124 domain-containing protein [Pseudomonadales bacterium]MDP4875141.1 DUF4124 domain-containing protein [Pseudomonadales bacterium]MDP4910842.1 DUF4124 domain-containing protein [Pseudomonadales bacterium]MDP5058465.1 DUF4124 domain-containing protein [Pseudomonadales bacterium]